MRYCNAFTVGLLITLFSLQTAYAFRQFTDMLKGVKKTIGVNGGDLSTRKIDEL